MIKCETGLVVADSPEDLVGKSGGTMRRLWSSQESRIYACVSRNYDVSRLYEGQSELGYTTLVQTPGKSLHSFLVEFFCQRLPELVIVNRDAVKALFTAMSKGFYPTVALSTDDERGSQFRVILTGEERDAKKSVWESLTGVEIDENLLYTEGYWVIGMEWR